MAVQEDEGGRESRRSVVVRSIFLVGERGEGLVRAAEVGGCSWRKCERVILDVVAGRWRCGETRRGEDAGGGSSGWLRYRMA